MPAAAQRLRTGQGEQAPELRVLVVHKELNHRVFECAELWQYLRGLAGADAGGRLAIEATDCRRVYRVHIDERRADAVVAGPLVRVLRRSYDVAIAFGPLPWYHLVVALAVRARGAPVAFFPLALLTEDFARGSWFVGRGRAFRSAKPAMVRSLAWGWNRLARVICCASAEEARQSRFPARKVVLVPWPVPDSELAEAALAAGRISRRGDGPVALVSRYDPWRKGFDRVAAWLERHGDALPRPAALLLAPDDHEHAPETRARLLDLEARGLLEWDRHSSGRALLGQLARCRGVVLLSRWEGQPRAIREALLAGLPAIVTPSCNLAELFSVLGGGLVVSGDDPGEIDQAFRALERLRLDPDGVRGALDPHRLGTFLLGVLTATAEGRPVPVRSYYDTLTEEATSA